MKLSTICIERNVHFGFWRALQGNFPGDVRRGSQLDCAQNSRGHQQLHCHFHSSSVESPTTISTKINIEVQCCKRFVKLFTKSLPRSCYITVASLIVPDAPMTVSDSCKFSGWPAVRSMLANDCDGAVEI